MNSRHQTASSYETLLLLANRYGMRRLASNPEPSTPSRIAMANSKLYGFVCNLLPDPAERDTEDALAACKKVIDLVG
jgi:hypothetical protein